MSVSIVPLEQPICPSANGCSALGNFNSQRHSTTDDEALEKGLSSALHKVQVVIGGAWKSQHNIKIERITGGFSNYLYKLSLPDDVQLTGNEPSKVLVRIYGDSVQLNSDSMIMDILIFALLSEKKIGPKLFGVFPGGRIEEYIESRVLKREEMRLPHMIKRIATIMSDLHQLRMPISKTPDRYFKNMKENLDCIRRQADRLPESVRQLLIKYNLAEECKFMSSIFLEQHQSKFPVVFSHNDVHENNLLYIESSEDEDGFKLLPIDFEFCCYGFRAFDIGNHFNEWCYDYTVTEWPRFAYRPEDYPSKAEQARFWQSYLSARQSDNETQDNPQTEDDEILHPILAEKLEVEVFYGSSLSHLYWALWGFAQGCVSSIDFGYVEYAIDRLQRYFENKSRLPPIV